MTDAPPAERTPLEARADEVHAQVVQLLERARDGGWSSGEARGAVERLLGLTGRLREDAASEAADHAADELRINEILDVMLGLAGLDFSRRAPVYGDGALDALASSANMLAEEVSAAQQAMAEATAAAEAATIAKSRFLAHMSHEIRTPLTALIGFADLLSAESVSDSDRLNYAMIVRRNGEHLLSVINDILDLSRVEAGQLRVELIECSPAEILAEIASLMRVRASETRLSFDVRLDGAIPSAARTDPTRLRQIILNLVSNALKFTQEGGVQVVARFDAATSMFEVEVKDTGIGMTQEQVAELFKPFRQGDISMSRRFGGSGLGLAICKALAEALGGRVGVSSEPGHGSTFCVAVRVEVAKDVAMIDALDVVQAAHPDARRAAAQLSGSVLLAEDGPDNQVLVSTLLRAMGLTVAVVENGKLAVAHTLSASRNGRAYDVVLMDMQMPVMDGYRAVALLRSEGYRRPIVAVTAHVFEGERERCLAAGCDDYLAKPLDRQKLVAMLQRYVVPKASAVLAPLRSNFADDPAMVPLVSRFVEAMPERAAALVDAWRERDRPKLGRLAHQLKGAAGGYGFPTITEAASELGAALRTEAKDPTVQRLVDELCAQCARAATGGPS